MQFLILAFHESLPWPSHALLALIDNYKQPGEEKRHEKVINELLHAGPMKRLDKELQKCRNDAGLR
jgi:hypothetical protein